MTEPLIMFVEDEPTFRSTFEEQLRQAGLPVESFASSFEARQAYNATPEQYWLIVMDWVLPSPVTGRDFLTAVRQVDERVPVLVVTGDTEETGTLATRLGASRYFRKHADFSELIASIQEYHEQDIFYHEVAQSFQELMAADQSLLYRYHPRTEQLILGAWSGEPVPTPDQRRRLIDAGLDFYLLSIIQSDEPKFFGPEKTPAFLQQCPALPGWQRATLVPLRHMGKSIALIVSFSKTAQLPEQVAPARVQMMLRKYAGLAAESLDFKYYHRKDQDLLNFSKVLASQRNVDELAGAILTKATHLADAEYGCFYLSNKEKGELNLIDHQPDSARGMPKKIRIGQSIVGKAALDGSIQSIDDTTQACSIEPLKAKNCRSQIAVPLRRSDLIIGVIVIGHSHANAFSDSDRSILQSLSDLASPALDQARQLQHLQMISRAVLASQDSKPLERRVVQAVYELTGLPVALWLVSEDGGQAKVGLHRGMQYPKEFSELQPVRLDQPQNTLVGLALSSKKPVSRSSIADPEEKPVFRDHGLAKKEGWHSILVVPFYDSEGRPLGTINLYGSQQQKFGETETHFLQGFASQVAISFENRSRRQNLERLVQSGQLALEGTVSEAELLERFVKLACRLTGAPCAVIYPFDVEEGDFFEAEKVAAFGLLVKRKTKTTKPHKEDLANIVRFMKDGVLVVHDLDNGRIGEVELTEMPAGQKIDIQSLPMLIQNQRDKPQDSFLAREQVKAFLAIALRARESEGGGYQHVGVLYINYRNPHRFTAAEVKTIQLFAQQVATRIRAARLLERQQKSLRLSQALERANHALTNAQEVDEVLRILFRQAFEFSDKQNGLILSVEKNGHLQIVEQKGVKQEQIDAFHRLETYEKSSFARVIEQGLLYETEDTQLAQKTDEMVDLHLPIPRQVTNLPVKVHGKVVAILVLDTFIQDRHIKDSLISLTEVAGVALQKILALQERSLQLDGIKKIMGTIGVQQYPLPAMLEEVVRLFAADTGSVSECISQTSERIPKALWEDGQLIDGPALEQRLADLKKLYSDSEQGYLTSGVTGRAQKTGEVQNVPDVSQDPAYLPWHPATRSELAVPIKNTRGEVIGILNLESHHLAAFTSNDVDLSQHLGSLVAAAIEKAGMFQRMQQMNQQLESLHQVVQEQGEEQVVERVLQAINQIFGEEYTTSNVNLYNENTDEFYTYKARGKAKELFEKAPRPKGQGVGRYVLHEWQQPLYIEDIHNPPPPCPSLNEAVRKGGVCSTAALPLGPDRQPFGTLFVHRTIRTVFSEDIQRVLESFARQASVAIENARMYKQRVDDILALQEVIDAITTQDLKTTLGLVVEQATRVVQGHFGQIWLIDEGTEELVLRATNQEHKPDSLGIRWKLDRQSINTWVARERQPRLVEDADAEPEFEKINPAACSSVTVPMIYHGGLIGTLNVESKSCAAFNQRDAELLSSFGGQVAVAIELSLSLTRRERNLAALREINSAIGDKSPQAINQLIARKAYELTGATYCTLWIKDEHLNLLKLGAVSGKPSYEKPPEHVAGLDDVRCMPIDDSSTNGFVALTRNPELIPDVRQSHVHYISWFEDIRCVLAVPVKDGPRVVGTLCVESIRPAAFSTPQRDLLLSLAEQFAIAIQNASAYQQRLDDFAAVQAINQAIGTLKLQEIYDLIAQKTIELTHGTYSTVWLWNEGRNCLEMQTCVGRKAIEDTISLDDKSINRLVINTKKARLSNNVNEDDNYYGWFEDIHSSLIVPMLYGDRLIGTLDVESTEFFAFKPQHIELLEALGRQACIALENARLLQSLQHRAADLLRLNEAGRAVNRTLEREHVLQSVLEQAQALSESTGASIWLRQQPGSELVCQQAIGPGADVLRGKSIPPGQGIATWVADHGVSELVDDATLDERHYKDIDQAISVDVRSIASIPLRGQETNIGTLQVVDIVPGKFQKDDLDILEPLAGFATAALENVRLYDEQQRLLKEEQYLNAGLKALSQASLELTTSLDRDAVLQEIIRQTQKLVGASDVHIFTYDGAELKFSAAWYDGSFQTGPYLEPRPEGMTYTAARTGEPVVVKDISHSPYFQTRAWGGALVSLPLKVKDRVRGVMNVAYPEPREISENDLRLLFLFVDQAAFTVENTRRQKRIEFDAIISSMLLKHFTKTDKETIIDVYNLIREIGNEILNVDNMYIALHDKQKNVISFPVACVDGDTIDTKTAKGWQERPFGVGRTEEVIQTQEYALTRTLAEAKAWYAKPGRQNYIHTDFASWVGVPIMYTEKDQVEEVLGVIAAYHKTQENMYNDEDVKTLQSTANSLALALQISRLLRTQQRSFEETKQLEALSERLLGIE